MTEWRATKASTPGIVWARYADALGLDKLRETFGEHWPPAGARHNEEVWVFRDPEEPAPVFSATGHPAAWLSLTIDQFDPSVVHMSRGVWPDLFRRGLGRYMRDFAHMRALELGARWLRIEVHASNAQHLASCRADSYWASAGLRYRPMTVMFEHELRQEASK